MDKISYSYVNHGELCFATWRGPRDRAIAAAVAYLNASPRRGAWTYLAEEIGETFLVTADDMAQLGAAVSDGRASNAYSYWCTECGTALAE